MGRYANLLEIIKRRFERYQSYYETLGINPDNVTDELVKQVYDNKCRELENMVKGIEEEEVQSIREIIQTELDDAYRALKTEDSRRNYQVVLDSIEGNER